MKKEHLLLLGKKCLPIVKRSKYGASDWDRDGNLNYLTGSAKIDYVNRQIDKVTNDMKMINKNQNWEVFSTHSDGTFTLRSDYGYEQLYVSRSDFRIIK